MSLPLAALVAREDLDVAPDRALGHYTHEKNPVACAAGLATLAVIEEEGLVARARELGERALARGLSFKVSMGNVVTLTPPLTIAESELERALDVLDRCLGELGG